MSFGDNSTVDNICNSWGLLSDKLSQNQFSSVLSTHSVSVFLSLES